LPGRFDIRKIKDSTIILDGAHNPQGTAALVETVSEVFPGEGIPIVFASMGDKDYCQSLDLLRHLKGDLFLTQVPGMDRSANPGHLLEAAENQSGWPGKVTVMESPQHALEEALKTSGTVLCCGSLYLLAAILELIEPMEVA
jgi:dihydrofolate synthase/folylpolyglutamate synthase